MSTTLWTRFSNTSGNDNTGTLPTTGRARHAPKPIRDRARSTSATRHWSTRDSSRRGFAVSELLIMFAAIGFVLAGILTLVPYEEEGQDAAVTAAAAMQEVETVAGHEVLLGDDYLCIVRLVRLDRPDSLMRRNHVCRVQIARRHPAGPGPFLLDIVASELPSWYATADYRVLTLVSAEEGEAFLRAHAQAALEAPGLSEQLRQLRKSFYRPPELTPASSIDEVFSRCVPAGLRESGVFVTSEFAPLEDIREIPGLSLDDIAAAIRSAADRDHWTTTDLPTLFAQPGFGDAPLTIPEEDVVAQSLIYGLLEYLPQQ